LLYSEFFVLSMFKTRSENLIVSCPLTDVKMSLNAPPKTRTEASPVQPPKGSALHRLQHLNCRPSLRVAVGLGGREYSLTFEEIDEVLVKATPEPEADAESATGAVGNTFVASDSDNEGDPGPDEKILFAPSQDRPTPASNAASVITKHDDPPKSWVRILVLQDQGVFQHMKAEAPVEVKALKSNKQSIGRDGDIGSGIHDAEAELLSRIRVLSVCTIKLKTLIHQKIRCELDDWEEKKEAKAQDDMEQTHESRGRAASRVSRPGSEHAQQFGADQILDSPPSDLLRVPSERFLDIFLAEPELTPGILTSNAGGAGDPDPVLLAGCDADAVVGSPSDESDESVVVSCGGTSLKRNMSQSVTCDRNGDILGDGEFNFPSSKVLTHLQEERPHFIVAVKPFPYVKFQADVEGDCGNPRDLRGGCVSHLNAMQLPKKLVWDPSSTNTAMKTWNMCEYNSNGTLKRGDNIGNHTVCAKNQCHYLVGTWTEAVLAVFEWLEWPFAHHVDAVPDDFCGAKFKDHDTAASSEPTLPVGAVLKHLRGFLARDWIQHNGRDRNGKFGGMWLQLREGDSEDHRVAEATSGNNSSSECNRSSYLAVERADMEYILYELFLCMAPEHPSMVGQVSSPKMDCFNYVARVLDGSGDSLLHVAAFFRCHAFIRKILESEQVRSKSGVCVGVDNILNQKNAHGRTPFYLAASRCDAEVVNLMLTDADLDVDAADLYGGTAFHNVVARGDLVLAEALISNEKVDLNAACLGWTALHGAATGGFLGIAKLLLENDRVDVNARTKTGETAMHMAAEKGHHELLKLLLSNRKVLLNAVTKNGWTALHMAAASGQVATVSLLISSDLIDVNAQDKWLKQTPLHLAAEEGCVAVVELLSSDGRVNVDGENYEGKTALDVARSRSKLEIIALLERCRDRAVAAVVVGQK
jgi:ankyrin repeat protein